MLVPMPRARRHVGISQGKRRRATDIDDEMWKNDLRNLKNLFVAQGDQGITPEGTAGRNVAGEKCGQQKYGGDRAESSGVDGGNSVQRGFHDAASNVCSGQAEKQSGNRELHAFPQHHEKHASGTGTERHSHSDFTGTLSNRERYNAINTDGGEKSRDRSESGK